MPTNRLFLDIRYYESDHENVTGASLPDGPGRIFRLPMSIHFLGARIARKLREYGFTAGEFDHLYVNYTTVLSEGQTRYSPREVEERIRYIDFGLSPVKTNALSETEKEAIVAASTFHILRFVAGNRSSHLALVDRVRADIEEKGSQVEIVHKKKETAAYSVTVSYQIRPDGGQSVGWVEYHEKKSGQRWKSQFVTLNHYEDLFALVGSISVSDRLVRLRPRASYKAGLSTSAYKTPIEIPVAGPRAL